MAYGTINADVIGTSVANTSLGAGNASIMKNRIINGAMVIDQRNAGALTNPAVTATYYLDRWLAASIVASKYSIGQNAGSVTPPAGFTNYLGCTSLSAYSPTGSDNFNIQQRIEGYNVADLGWGTADAKTVTLSFWVYSSLTGTFGGSLRNSASSRSYPYSYTISSANTWEQKSITIAGDTTGTWLTTNGTGIVLLFSLGAGSTISGTAGAWAAGNYVSATGATSVVGTSGATFYITGVQLEVGSSATGFEYRQYGQELALCYRYCQNMLLTVGQVGGLTGMNQTTTATFFTVQNAFRATPTSTYSGGLNVISGNTPSPVTSVNNTYFNRTSATVSLICSGATWTAGYAANLYGLTTDGYLLLSAEL